MKALVLAVALLAATSGVLAKDAVRKDLVSEYMKAARVEQLHNAELEKVIRLRTADASAAEKAQIEKDLRKTMSWTAVRGQYASLVRRTYTQQELKSAVTYLKSPAGSKVSRKNIDFSAKAAQLLTSSALKKTRLKAPQDLDAADEAREAQDILEARKPEPKAAAKVAAAKPVLEKAPLEKAAAVAPAASKPAAEKQAPASIQSSSDLVLSGIEKQTRGGQLFFTGRVENKSKAARRGVQIDVNLFMGKRFVDQYSAFVSGSIAPGETRYFKVTCNCKEIGIPQHDSYKVQIVDSY